MYIVIPSEVFQEITEGKDKISWETAYKLDRWAFKNSPEGYIPHLNTLRNAERRVYLRKS